jgi:hypothetical protein
MMMMIIIIIIIIIILYMLSHVTELSDPPFITKRLCRETSPDFLGVFAKLQNAAVSFVMSVRPHVTSRLTLDGFSLNLTLECFSKIYRGHSSFIKILPQ